MTVGILINSICNQNSAPDWPPMTSNWKSIATFYIKKLWVIWKKYPQDYVRRSFEVAIKMRPPEWPRTTSDDLNGSKWKIYTYFHLLGSYSMQNVLKKWTKIHCNQNSASDWPRMTSNWKSIATFYIKKLRVFRKKYPQTYVRRWFKVTIKMRPPERPRTTSDDLNGSKWKIYIYFHLLGSYSMQNVLKKWTKMQIPSTKIVQLVTSKMEAKMDRPWNPSTNNENSCLNGY